MGAHNSWNTEHISYGIREIYEVRSMLFHIRVYPRISHPPRVFILHCTHSPVVTIMPTATAPYQAHTRTQQ